MNAIIIGIISVVSVLLISVLFSSKDNSSSGKINDIDQLVIIAADVLCEKLNVSSTEFYDALLKNNNSWFHERIGHLIRLIDVEAIKKETDNITIKLTVHFSDDTHSYLTKTIGWLETPSAIREHFLRTGQKNFNSQFKLS